MHPLQTWILVIQLCVSVPSFAADAEPADNQSLRVLFEEDQEDRRGFPNTKRSYVEINERDADRRERVVAMLKETQIRTAEDYFRAAVIFHHGQTFEHYRMAASLAWIAYELEPNNPKYQWQTASCWDRMMLKRGRPQWYGAQSQRAEDGRWNLLPLEESLVSDEERAKYNLKPLSELKAKPGQPTIQPIR